MNSFKQLLWISFLVSLACAQEPSLAPPVDPFPTPVSTPSSSSSPSPSESASVRRLRLFLSTAGAPPHVESPIMPYRRLRLCPKDYPSGFSIRCDTSALSPGRRVVTWHVGGAVYKKEYFAPYFLAGDWRDRIGVFRGLNGVVKGQRMRVGCTIRTTRRRMRVWVDLVKNC